MRVVLILFLLLATAPVFSAWVKVFETVGVVSYVDPTTLQKNGNIQKVWKLQDLKTRGSSGEMSRRLLQEYDCQGAKSRTVSITLHSESMGGGQLLFTLDTPTPWQPISPDAISATTKGVAVCAPAGQAGGTLDKGTDRREVRPGCAIVVFPGSKLNSNLRYTGGSCINGLLEGIVKIDGPNAGGNRVVTLQRYRAGRGVGLYMWMALVNGNWDYYTMDRDQNGKATAGAACPGRSAAERTSGEAACKAAARAFGTNAFDSAIMLSNQVPTVAAAGPGTGSVPAPGSASTGGWPAGVEPGNLYVVEYKFSSWPNAAYLLVASKSKSEVETLVNNAATAFQSTLHPDSRPQYRFTSQIIRECNGPNWGAVIYYVPGSAAGMHRSAWSCDAKTPKEAIVAATNFCSTKTGTACDRMIPGSYETLIVSIGHSGARSWFPVAPTLQGYPPAAMRWAALGATTAQFSGSDFVTSPQDAINQFGKACGPAGVHSCWITSKNWTCLNASTTRKQGDCLDTKLTAEGYLP